MILKKPCYGTLGSRLRTSKHLHKLLRFEFLRQLSETFIIAGGATTLYKLLILISKIVVSHLTEIELLALVLDLHRQAAKPAVSVIHCQRLMLLPFLPMAHQNKGQRDADAVVRHTLQQGTVCLVVVELSNLHVA